jgi:hypothetical protein
MFAAPPCAALFHLAAGIDAEFGRGKAAGLGDRNNTPPLRGALLRYGPNLFPLGVFRNSVA